MQVVTREEFLEEMVQICLGLQRDGHILKHYGEVRLRSCVWVALDEVLQSLQNEVVVLHVQQMTGISHEHVAKDSWKPQLSTPITSIAVHNVCHGVLIPSEADL